MNTLLLPLLFALAGERYVAIDNVCAWPNLKILPDGTLAAIIFNQPSHAAQPGHVEVWTSRDGGKMWALAGVPVPHAAKATRHNHSAGIAHDGSLVVLVSGMTLEHKTARLLPAVASRSRDNGKTWEQSHSFQLPTGVDYIIPYGDIVQLPNNTLASTFYYDNSLTAVTTGPRPRPERRDGNTYVLFSRDDGRSWGNPVLIGKDNYNETALLRLRADRWLVAARAYRYGHLELFTSADEGRTWKNDGPLSLPSQHPAHLLKLKDGRILLTYGVREKGNHAVNMRLSADEGKTWSAARPIVQLGDGRDSGYPSTVELPDGTLVTAYYSAGIPEHQRYHMGVLRWTLDK